MHAGSESDWLFFGYLDDHASQWTPEQISDGDQIWLPLPIDVFSASLIFLLDECLLMKQFYDVLE